jgi:predicted nucleic acid-binding Zn ribbon protein
VTTPDHDPQGLDLARQVARAARGETPAPPRPARKRPATPSRDGLEPLGELIRDVIDDQGWSTDVRLHHLLGGWPALVGEVNAAHSTPESFAERVLTVRAESTTWASSLREIAPQLVARLNDHLGQGTVERVVVLGPAAPSWKKGRRSVPGRGPRDTYG